MPRLRLAPLVAVAAVVPLLAACGSSGGDGGNASPSPPASGQTVTISETEFKLDPSAIPVDATGTVTIHVVNDGQVVHALEVEGNGLEEQKTADIQPGQSVDITVDLAKKGTYKMYCPIDGHRAQGMEGTITVGGAAASQGGGSDNSGSGSGGGYGSY
jgi:uncharacterized cupredoxin-like copper-binding protein